MCATYLVFGALHNPKPSKREINSPRLERCTKPNAPNVGKRSLTKLALKRSGKSKQKKNPATRRWQGFNKYNLLGAYLVCAERTASRYTRPRKVPQDGQAMCGNASEPQFGQVTVCTADAFQLARRECVLAREVLYLGSAIIFLYFVQSIELKRSVYYSKRRTFSRKCSKNSLKQQHFPEKNLPQMFQKTTKTTTFSGEKTPANVPNQHLNSRWKPPRLPT